MLNVFFKKNVLPILIYHRVFGEGEYRGNEPSEKEFDSQIGLLSHFYNFVTLREAVELLKNGCLPPRTAVITFDDGYRDNYTKALPILLKHNAKATFFVTTNYIDGGIMWNDSIVQCVLNSPKKYIEADWLTPQKITLNTVSDRLGLARKLVLEAKYLPPLQRDIYAKKISQICSYLPPNNLMMTKNQVKYLSAAGMEIGGHTVTHPILKNVDDIDAKSEILEGKLMLESWLDQELYSFAYPNGKPDADFTHRDVQSVREVGFKCAVTTANGIAVTGSDVFQLARFTPWQKNQWKFLASFLMNQRSKNYQVCKRN